MALESVGRNSDNVDRVHSNQESGEDKKSVPISFGFTKTSSKFKPPGLNRIESLKEERDYLTGVEGNELKSTKPVEQRRELIIPLINKNRGCWQEKSERGPAKKVDVPLPEDPDSVESQAVKELIEESRQQQENWKNETQRDPNLAIPLLMQNSMLQNQEDGEKVNVEQLPESSTEADYERVPVEAFGLAMLRGMGWKEGEGIGLTFKEVVKPIEHQVRPKGLGLGADRSALQDLQPSRPRRPPKPGEERPQEELVLDKGACVLLEAGAHRDHYGKVEGVDADNARVMVKLAIGGKNVTVSQYTIRVVSCKEYEKKGRDLSRHSKAYKDAERERKRENGEKERDKDKKKQRREDKEREEQRSAEKDCERQKGQEPAYRREKTPPGKYSRQTDSAPSWLQRDLRVRFIDKAFKGGKYYNSKMTVEDVLTPGTCVCRTDEGRLLDGVKQAMLETMVPKNEADSIMVVLGEHRGQVGRILQRDRERCRAVVQLDRSGEKIYTLDYDSICHYVGGDYM